MRIPCDEKMIFLLSNPRDILLGRFHNTVDEHFATRAFFLSIKKFLIGFELVTGLLCCHLGMRLVGISSSGWNLPMYIIWIIFK